MAHVTLRLEIDPGTHRRTIVVSYRADEDALPAEHEEQHRALVERVFGRRAAEESDLRVEREGEAVRDAGPRQEPAKRVAVPQKG